MDVELGSDGVEARVSDSPFANCGNLQREVGYIASEGNAYRRFLKGSNIQLSNDDLDIPQLLWLLLAVYTLSSARLLHGALRKACRTRAWVGDIMKCDRGTSLAYKGYVFLVDLCVTLNS